MAENKVAKQQRMNIKVSKDNAYFLFQLGSQLRRTGSTSALAVLDPAELAEMSRILNEDDDEAWGDRDARTFPKTSPGSKAKDSGVAANGGGRFRQTQTVFPHQVKAQKH